MTPGHCKPPLAGHNSFLDMQSDNSLVQNAWARRIFAQVILNLFIQTWYAVKNWKDLYEVFCNLLNYFYSLLWASLVSDRPVGPWPLYK